MQLTVRQVAKLLNTPESQVYRWINEGEIPYYRVNEQFRFNQAELLEWATTRRLPLSDQVFHDPDSSLPRLADALAIGGIYHGLAAKDREAVIRAVVARMPVKKESDREFLIQIWLARETAGLTSVGQGIAIPHVRSPVILNGSSPSITLCTLEQPVAVESLDGTPIHTIFAVVSPTVRTHLRILARLAAALHDPEFKAAILRRASKEEILRHARRLDEAAETSTETEVEQA